MKNATIVKIANPREIPTPTPTVTTFDLWMNRDVGSFDIDAGVDPRLGHTALGLGRSRDVVEGALGFGVAPAEVEADVEAREILLWSSRRTRWGSESMKFDLRQPSFAQAKCILLSHEMIAMPSPGLSLHLDHQDVSIV